MKLNTLRSFAEKVAFVASTPKMKNVVKADEHHFMDNKDWKGFEKNLKAKGFQNAIKEHPMSDKKLKRYVKNFGGYLNSKKVVGSVPSRTTGKVYKVKELPNGRLACGCKDWQYNHSHKSTDCEHIRELKQGLEKKSSNSLLSSAARGVAYTRTLDKMKAQAKRGDLIHENVRRLSTGEPLLMVGHH